MVTGEYDEDCKGIGESTPHRAVRASVGCVCGRGRGVREDCKGIGGVCVWDREWRGYAVRGYWSATGITASRPSLPKRNYTNRRLSGMSWILLLKFVILYSCIYILNQMATLPWLYMDGRLRYISPKSEMKKHLSCIRITRQRLWKTNRYEEIPVHIPSLQRRNNKERPTVVPRSSKTIHLCYVWSPRNRRSLTDQLPFPLQGPSKPCLIVELPVGSTSIHPPIHLFSYMCVRMFVPSFVMVKLIWWFFYPTQA